MNLDSLADHEQRLKWNADAAGAVPDVPTDDEVAAVLGAWRADRRSVPMVNPDGLKWRWKIDEDTARHVARDHRVWLEGWFVRRVLAQGAVPVRLESGRPERFAVLSTVVGEGLKLGMREIAGGGTLLLALARGVEALAAVSDGAVLIGGG